MWSLLATGKREKTVLESPLHMKKEDNHRKRRGRDGGFVGTEPHI